MRICEPTAGGTARVIGPTPGRPLVDENKRRPFSFTKMAEHVVLGSAGVLSRCIQAL